MYVDYATNTWWIDSGATVHVANFLQGFATKMTLRKGERKIRVANGVEVEAEAVGVFTLLLHTGFELCRYPVTGIPTLTAARQDPRSCP